MRIILIRNLMSNQESMKGDISHRMNSCGIRRLPADFEGCPARAAVPPRAGDGGAEGRAAPQDATARRGSDRPRYVGISTPNRVTLRGQPRGNTEPRWARSPR
jgi:hypothetical protein